MRIDEAHAHLDEPMESLLNGRYKDENGFQTLGRIAGASKSPLRVPRVAECVDLRASAYECSRVLDVCI